MKKLTHAIALCLAIVCSLNLLASCQWLNIGDIPEENNPGAQPPSVDNNPTDDNKADGEHKHTLAKINKSEPSCENPGVEEYYTCSGCNKLFADAEGKSEISAPVTIDKLGHSWSNNQLEDENGLYVECGSCGTKKRVSPTVADSYSAVHDDEFVSDRSYSYEMHYGSKGVSHKGGDDKSNVREGFMGGIDNVGEYVSYQFIMSSAGTVDIVWTVAGNYYSNGNNLGISDMAAHMLITIDGKPVNVSGIELPAINGDLYMEKWWMLRRIVIEDVVLDAGTHTFKCEVIKKGGVNIDDLTIYSNKPISSDLKADAVDANLTLEDGKVYYHLTYDVAGYSPSDFEFFNGEKIYPFTYSIEGSLITFKFDFTGHATGTFYPHMRLQGNNWGHEKGDVILDFFDNYNTAFILDCVNYKLGIEYDMPCVFISVQHEYGPSVITAPTLTSEGKGEVRCVRCNLLNELVGEITLPVLSAENGYEVTEGAFTRYTYAVKAFTNIHTVYVFDFNINAGDYGEQYNFGSSELFADIGSTTAERNENGYYEGKSGDSFAFVVKAESDVTVRLLLRGNDSFTYGAGVLSSITVNGRASETYIYGDSIHLVLEKGTNTVCFTLKEDINLYSVTINSRVNISLIDPDRAYELTLMSYNIRIDANSDYQDWDMRKPYLATHILSYSPDVICFQEVKKNQYNDLITLLGETYEIVWYARQVGTNPEGLAVAYKKAGFTEVSRGMFWLSETPEVESMGWDAQSYLRIAVNVIIKHNESGQTINVYSVHLDSHAREACHKSMELVMQRASQYDYPVYIAGDFNATDISYAYHVTDAQYHSAQYVSQVTDFSNTAGFGGEWIGVPNYTVKPIDHIFVSTEHFVPVEYKPCRDKWGEGYFHSDHLAIVSKVLLLT